MSPFNGHIWISHYTYHTDICIHYQGIAGWSSKSRSEIKYVIYLTTLIIDYITCSGEISSHNLFSGPILMSCINCLEFPQKTNINFFCVKKPLKSVILSPSETSVPSTPPIKLSDTIVPFFDTLHQMMGLFPGEIESV